MTPRLLAFLTTVRMTIAPRILMCCLTAAVALSHFKLINAASDSNHQRHRFQSSSDTILPPAASNTLNASKTPLKPSLNPNSKSSLTKKRRFLISSTMNRNFDFLKQSNQSIIAVRKSKNNHPGGQVVHITDFLHSFLQRKIDHLKYFYSVDYVKSSNGNNDEKQHLSARQLIDHLILLMTSSIVCSVAIAAVSVLAFCFVEKFENNQIAEMELLCFKTMDATLRALLPDRLTDVMCSGAADHSILRPPDTLITFEEETPQQFKNIRKAQLQRPPKPRFLHQSSDPIPSHHQTSPSLLSKTPPAVADGLRNLYSIYYEKIAHFVDHQLLPASAALPSASTAAEASAVILPPAPAPQNEQQQEQQQTRSLVPAVRNVSFEEQQQTDERHRAAAENHGRQASN